MKSDTLYTFKHYSFAKQEIHLKKQFQQTQMNGAIITAKGGLIINVLTPCFIKFLL